jgi:membrane-bound serine protease (ClpP class)
MEDESHRLTGRTGEAITTLRPVGKAEIDDEVMVVESEGEFIESGSRIEVIAVNGNRVVVRGV